MFSCRPVIGNCPLSKEGKDKSLRHPISIRIRLEGISWLLLDLLRYRLVPESGTPNVPVPGTPVGRKFNSSGEAFS